MWSMPYSASLFQRSAKRPTVCRSVDRMLVMLMPPGMPFSVMTGGVLSNATRMVAGV